VNRTTIIQHVLQDDGVFPNNPALSLLLYPQAVELTGPDPAAVFERLFAAHRWGHGWRNGVFSYHHYHSSAHEVLGVYRGDAEVQFGGEEGVIAEVTVGDVVIIPAGVAHKKLHSSRDFAVVGAYPIGQRPDTCYGEPGERPKANQRIAGLALPEADPVWGQDGGLLMHWRLVT